MFDCFQVFRKGKTSRLKLLKFALWANEALKFSTKNGEDLQDFVFHSPDCWFLQGIARRFCIPFTGLLILFKKLQDFVVHSLDRWFHSRNCKIVYSIHWIADFIQGIERFSIAVRVRNCAELKGIRKKPSKICAPDQLGEHCQKELKNWIISVLRYATCFIYFYLVAPAWKFRKYSKSFISWFERVL